MAAASRSAHPRAATPSRTDPAVIAMAGVLASHLRAFTREHLKALAGDVEAIHRMRVATRRMRAALRMLEELMPDGPAKPAAQELAWLCDAIGKVRDLDVLVAGLTGRAARLDPDFIRALDPLWETIRRRRAEEQTRLGEALHSERCGILVQRLGATPPEPSPEAVTLGATASRIVRPIVRAVLRAGAGLDETSPSEALHRLRVRVKRLRYGLEPLQAVGGKALSKMLERLEDVQERVGAYHDAVTAVAWLRGWAESGDVAHGTLMATGALIHSFERRVRRLHRRSLKAWRRARTAELSRAVLGELDQAAARTHRAAKPPLVLVPLANVS